MEQWILQIADLHLIEGEKNNLSIKTCVDHIAQTIEENQQYQENLLIAVCGDVTSQGLVEGYDYSVEFLQTLSSKLPNEPKVIMCPGNHDISKEDKPFKAFNAAAYKFGQNVFFDENNTSICLPVNDVDLILVNSAHHGDHKYGSVDEQELVKTLNEGDKDNKIVIVHHHVLASSGDKGAGIANAQEFLNVCDAANVKAILHGHTHSQTSLLFGINRIPVIGVSSLFQPPQPNHNNEFNFVKLSENGCEQVDRYRFMADVKNSKGLNGHFVKFEQKYT